MAVVVRTQIRVDEKDYSLLRKLSYLNNKSINYLMNEGIKQFLEKEKNLLKNADIVIS